MLIYGIIHCVVYCLQPNVLHQHEECIHSHFNCLVSADKPYQFQCNPNNSTHSQLALAQLQEMASGKWNARADHIQKCKDVINSYKQKQLDAILVNNHLNECGNLSMPNWDKEELKDNQSPDYYPQNTSQSEMIGNSAGYRKFLKDNDDIDLVQCILNNSADLDYNMDEMDENTVKFRNATKKSSSHEVKSFPNDLLQTSQLLANVFFPHEEFTVTNVLFISIDKLNTRGLNGT